MRILLTGSKGQLGTEFQRLVPAYGFTVVPFDVDELDITNLAQVKQTVADCNPKIIVNAAAYTAVDKAESDRKTAFAVNQHGPANLAQASAEAKIPLFHVSTDYVFDGGKKDPYLENDVPNPLSVYGETKEAGEREVRQWPSHIILRTSWVYSPFGNNFVKTIIKLAREREEVKIINDQHGSPTSAKELASAILTIIDRFSREKTLPWGTYHYCGNDLSTWFGFAQAIVAEARKYETLRVKSILPILTEAYPLPAKRPKNSALDCSLIEKTFSIGRKSWRESLTETIKELYS